MSVGAAGMPMRRFSIELESDGGESSPRGVIFIVESKAADDVANKIVAAVGGGTPVAIVHEGTVRVHDPFVVLPGMPPGEWTERGPLRFRLGSSGRAAASFADNSSWQSPEVEVCAEGATQGFGVRHRLPLRENESVTVGRADDAGIRVDDASASRQHARITRLNGEYVVTDLKSRWGTMVNEERLSGSRRLEHLDRIRIGTSTLHFTSYGERLLELASQQVEPLPAGTPTGPVGSPIDPAIDSRAGGDRGGGRSDPAVGSSRPRGSALPWVSLALASAAALGFAAWLIWAVFYGMRTG